jgi:hypothetical protein
MTNEMLFRTGVICPRLPGYRPDYTRDAHVTISNDGGAMKVRELVTIPPALPDQNAIVVSGRF